MGNVRPDRVGSRQTYPLEHLASGIEETVALQLDSPTQGAHLITAIGDYGGFVHWDLIRPAPDGSSAPPRFGNTTDWLGGVAASGNRARGHERKTYAG